MSNMFAAKDKIDETRRAYYQGKATYDDMADAARAYLELARAAEIARFGKAKTKVSKLAIAALLR